MWESLSLLGELPEMDVRFTTGISIWMVGHVDTSVVGGLLLESLNLTSGIIDGEELEEGLWSLFMLVWDLLWCGMWLLLLLSLTTVKGHVDGDDSLIENTGIANEFVILKGSDTVLEFHIIGGDVNLVGNLLPNYQ